MSKNISISDDVYEWLNEMKGEESFSSIIRKLGKSGNLEDINGLNILEGWGRPEVN